MEAARSAGRKGRCPGPVARKVNMAPAAAIGAMLLMCAAAGGCAEPSFWARRGTIDAGQFAPADHLLAAGGRDAGTEQYHAHGDVKLYAAADGRLIHQISLGGRVSELAFNPRGDRLAVSWKVSREEGSSLDGLSVFDVSAGKAPTAVFQVRQMHLTLGLRFSPDSRFLAARGWEKTTLWNTDGWEEILVIEQEGAEIAFSPDSKLLAIAARGGEAVQVWDLEGPRKLRKIPGAGPVLFDPSGPSLLFHDKESGRIAGWHVGRGRVDLLLDVPDSHAPTAMALSARGKLAAIVAARRPPLLSSGHKLCLWDLRTPAKSPQAVRNVPAGSSIDFANGGDVLVLGTDRGVRLLDPKSGRRLAKLPANKGDALAVSRGKLATLSSGELLVVWDIRGPSRPTPLWEDHWRRHRWSPLE